MSNSSNNKKTLLLGVGNILRKDDGVGPKIIEALKKKNLPENIILEDGGIDGLNLIEWIKLYPTCYIIDAVNMNETLGSIKIFSSDDAVLKVKNDSLSTHGFGISEVVNLAKGLGIKTEIFIIGIQPEDISFGEDLSNLLKGKFDYYLETIIKEITS